MNELLILTKAEADANQGEYKPFHEVMPVKIGADFYVLNRSLSEVPELAAYKDAILAQPFFTVGDGSPEDLIYQQHLIDEQTI